MRNGAAEISLHDSLFMWPLSEPSYNMHMAKQWWLPAPHGFSSEARKIQTYASMMWFLLCETKK